MLQEVGDARAARQDAEQATAPGLSTLPFPQLQQGFPSTTAQLSHLAHVAHDAQPQREARAQRGERQLLAPPVCLVACGAQGVVCVRVWV